MSNRPKYGYKKIPWCRGLMDLGRIFFALPLGLPLSNLNVCGHFLSQLYRYRQPCHHHSSPSRPALPPSRNRGPPLPWQLHFFSSFLCWAHFPHCDQLHPDQLEASPISLFRPFSVQRFCDFHHFPLSHFAPLPLLPPAFSSFPASVHPCHPFSLSCRDLPVQAPAAAQHAPWKANLPNVSFRNSRVAVPAQAISGAGQGKYYLSRSCVAFLRPTAQGSGSPHNTEAPTSARAPS